MPSVLQNPELYDTLYKNVTDDINFYITALKNVHEIVEYGAGSGRITLPLAYDGHSVIAVDNEPAMLKQLQRRIGVSSEIVKQRISVVQADIVNLSFVEKKECILVPFTTFNYLLTDQQQETCLKNIASSLKKDGVAAFELITLNTYKEVGENTSSFQFIERFPSQNGLYYLYYRKTVYNPDTKIIAQNRVFELYNHSNTKVNQYEYDWKNRYISLDCFLSLAKKYGLILSSAYGNTSFDPYTDKSNDLFVILQKV